MSVLKQLESVFTIERGASGGFKIEESCDCYYSETLSPEELVKLGEEIIALGRQKPFWAYSCNNKERNVITFNERGVQAGTIEDARDHRALE